ncbi:hypothetical protein DB35_04350 [Streptomyces abyssalis]|uniref:DUF6879 domain-containing protein n=1 Tax=Streptomyces abyssalis TaxID=933944 RepID=A0A1E7JQ89_9ACTN|nr:DUF6879 family protein [Streptomyces abyssalis]OEU90449.1 hypothetical protein AN215_13445 [Streptomyces abyssalis]OEU95186.1 hypothetical protein DB35_04350 [Streptomyces abyssalis]
MSDHTPLALDRSRGDRLGLAEYRHDFRQRDEAVTGRHSWKFERRQHFQEQSSPSWEAFRRGKWEEALRLTGEGRKHWQSIAREDAERGSVFHRVRVVEEPLTPYMQWELHALRVQGESGLPVRVVDGRELRRLESAGPLPEVVVLGGEVLYEVVYTDDGFLDGGVRHTAPESIASWERFITRLYEEGEEIGSYFSRRVSHLPAPMTSQVADHH